MATHAERLALAREVADALLERHGAQNLLAIGLHGSVARGNDDDASDIDIAVITAYADVHVPDRIRRVRGVIVDVGAITGEAYLEEAGQVGPTWPIASDQYVTTLALHDPTGYFERLRETHQQAMATAPSEAFAEAAALGLLRTLDSLGVARRHVERREPAAAWVALSDVTIAIALTLGLLTRRTAANAVSLVGSVVAEDWGLPAITEPVARALATAEAPLAYAALVEAFEALEALCADAGVPWDANDVRAVVP